MHVCVRRDSSCRQRGTVMSFSKPSDCHHQEREAHLCHFNQCPDCRQPCNLPLQGCAHRCSVVCHDSVLVKEETNASNTPWGAKEKVARKPLPCPSCPVPTAVGCFGRHTVRSACCEPSYRVFFFLSLKHCHAPPPNHSAVVKRANVFSNVRIICVIGLAILCPA